jgi:glutaconate CoA-transferase, subunit A
MKTRENMTDKRISFDEATSSIPSASVLALGGLTNYRRPVQFAKALVRRYLETGTPNNLTLLAFTGGIESDLLVGAGMVSRVRTCYFGLEIFGLAPMFTYLANRGEIEIIEETEASISFGLRANLAGVGFMPGRGWLGTDLPKLRPDVKTIRDPYSGEELIAFPAIHPEIAVIHALYADREGNAQIGDNKGFDSELALAADVVIITAEEILPELNKLDIAGPFVDAVIAAPFGALPTSCHPNYALDGETLLEYTENVSDPTSFKVFMQKFLYP